MKTFLKILLLFLTAALLNACTGSTKNFKSKPIQTADNNGATNKKRLLQNGTDFYATGNQPSIWQLQINYDDSVRFFAEDGLTLTFGFNQLQKESNAERDLLKVTLKGADIQITIFNKACADQNMLQTQQKEVLFSFKNITYRGCGGFVANDLLNGRWKLNKLSSASIQTEDYKRVPLLIFDLLANSITGNDGCNTIKGTMEVQGKRIRFFKINTAGTTCNKKNISAILAQQMSEKLVSYYFKDNRLYLYLPDDSLMEFIKN